MLMKYMVTYKECGFHGAKVDYVNSVQDAVCAANSQHEWFGYTPEAIYEYDPTTKKYDKLYGKFNAKRKEA